MRKDQSVWDELEACEKRLAEIANLLFPSWAEIAEDEKLELRAHSLRSDFARLGW